MRTRINSLIHRFRRGNEGAVAVEFAFITPILAGLFLATLDLGATGFTQNKLTSSLRFSAQYVANGGENLTVAEDVFGRSYGSYQSFSAAVSCSCARGRSALDGDEQDPDNTSSTVDEVLGAISGSTADAPQCESSCGEDPIIRYLTLSASAERLAIWGDETKIVSNSVSVRLH